MSQLRPENTGSRTDGYVRPVPIEHWQSRVNQAASAWARFRTVGYYRLVFGAIGHGSRIFKPLLLSNPQYVYIGDRTYIRPGARIETVVLDKNQPPSLIIGNDVSIEQNVHLVCSSRIFIGDNVTITGNCAIVDTRHPFLDVGSQGKIVDRIDPMPAPIYIGNNSFLGFGSVILPGVHIGNNCVIGANSVVMHDLPDYSVAAGNPAVIVMRFDERTTGNVTLPK